MLTAATAAFAFGSTPAAGAAADEQARSGAVSGLSRLDLPDPTGASTPRWVSIPGPDGRAGAPVPVPMPVPVRGPAGPSVAAGGLPAGFAYLHSDGSAEAPGLAEAVASLPAPANAGTAALEAGTGTIAGTVSVDGKGAPPSPVWVAASAFVGTAWAGTYAAANGSFTIPGLPPGDYRVSFAPEAEDLVPEYYPDARAFYQAAPVTVTADQTTAGIDASLDPAGFITGTVTAAGTGLPVAGAWIMASEPGAAFSSTQSAANGAFRIGQLPAGTAYTVRFDADIPSLAGEYYDNKSGLLTADVVAVIAGQATVSINAALEPAATIRGTVTAAATNAPVGGVQVDAYDPATGGSGSTQTAANGTYTLGALRPGSYTVSFTPGDTSLATEYFDDVGTPDLATPVVLAAGQAVTKVDAALEPGGQIAGTVTEASTGLPASGVMVMASSAESGWEGAATTETDGSYEISGLREGSYRVLFRPPTLFQMPQYYDDTTSASASTPVEVNADEATTGINAALRTGGMITGTVTSADTGQPAADVLVCTSDAACGTSDANGTYSVAGVATGAQSVLFMPLSDPYLATAFLGGGYPGPGSTVIVTQNHVTTAVNAGLPAGGSISGTVHGPDGTAVHGVAVCPVQGGSCSAASGPQGTYRLGSLPPGLRAASTSASWGYGSGYSAPVPVVALADIPDVDFHLSLGPLFSPLTPQRLLDTRPGTLVGYSGVKPAAGSTVTLQVSGLSSPVPDEARAVALNVTGVQPSASGYVTVWPCDATRPTASNLNLQPGANVANLVVSRVSESGTVCLYTSGGTHLLADVTGYASEGSALAATPSQRLLDTRPGSLIGYSGPKPGAGSTVEVVVTAAGSPVPDDASAVIMNVTGVQATAAGFVTVWPCGTVRPTASNLNLQAGVNRPNLVVTDVGDNGKVCLFTSGGTHLLADVAGYVPAGTAFHPLVPQRLLDTRPGTQVGYVGGKPAAGATIELAVAGDGSTVWPTATTVVLNVTGVQPGANGFVTVWPCGTVRPTSSSLNLQSGTTSANLVITGLGAGGKVCLYTSGGTHMLADVAGFVTP